MNMPFNYGQATEVVTSAPAPVTVNPEGTQLAIIRGHWQFDVVLFHNVQR